MLPMLAIALVGCAASESGPMDPSLEGREQHVHGTLLATATLAADHLVDFYELEPGAGLVVETGVLGSERAVPKNGVSSFEALYQELTASTPGAEDDGAVIRLREFDQRALAGDLGPAAGEPIAAPAEVMNFSPIQDAWFTSNFCIAPTELCLEDGANNTAGSASMLVNGVTLDNFSLDTTAVMTLQKVVDNAWPWPNSYSTLIEHYPVGPWTYVNWELPHYSHSGWYNWWVDSAGGSWNLALRQWCVAYSMDCDPRSRCIPWWPSAECSY
jgi:hypothetical protein